MASSGTEATTAPETHGVALLGAGIFSKSKHLPALAAAEKFTLKAVYSRSSASAISLAQAASAFPSTSHAISTYWDKDTEGSEADDSGIISSGDLSALLDNPDIQTVILSLPITVQPAIIRQAWEKGRNVISEKPVGPSVAAATELIELWEREYKPKGISWIIAEQYPYEPSFEKIRQLLADGRIGDLRSFNFSFYNFVEEGSKYQATSWRTVPDYQGGFCLDGGVHWAAGLRWMLPTALTSITATTTLIQPHLPPVDTIFGLLKTNSNVPGTFSLSFGTEPSPTEPRVGTYTFRGSKGTLHVDLSNLLQVTTLTPSVAEAGSDHDTLVIELNGRAVDEEFLAFSDALVAGPDSAEAHRVEERSGPRAALKDVEFIEAALKSGESGEWVSLST